MATYPIKVLLDRARKPFIPFSTTSSIVENGTNRRLDKILGNLDDLQTSSKTSLVSAINEAYTSGGSSLGLKLQVVSELPTENISESTIYLVPHTGASAPNIYEEWIYVNNAWEIIGTTEVDLSSYATTSMVGDLNTLSTTDKDNIVEAINEVNTVAKSASTTAEGVSTNLGNYYTKEESDNKYTYTAGTNVTIENNVISAGGEKNPTKIYEVNPNIGVSYIQFVDKTIIGDIITNMYKDGSSYPILRVAPNTASSINTIPYVDFRPSSATPLSSQRVQYFFMGQVYMEHTGSPVQLWNTYLAYSYITINGKWSNDTYTCTSVNYSSIYNKKLEDIALVTNVLTKTNTTSYTPTADYHPATKKYVDDTVAASSGSGVDLSNYYTKEEVDDKASNYLSKTNTAVYEPTSDYHPATKKFVENVMSSIDLSSYYTKTEVDTVAKGYQSICVLCNNNLSASITETATDVDIVNDNKVYTTLGLLTSDTDNLFKFNAVDIGKGLVEVTISYKSTATLKFSGQLVPPLYYMDTTDEEVAIYPYIYSDNPVNENTLVHTYHYVYQVLGTPLAFNKEIYMKRTMSISTSVGTANLTGIEIKAQVFKK